MRTLVFLLFALLGLCCASVPAGTFPVTYTYKYNSTVRVGVPNRSDQQTQFGLRCNVVISLPSASEATFQIKDPKVFNWIGTLERKGTQTPSSIQWLEMTNGKDALLKPFKVLISEGQEVLQVDSSEPLYSRNIKKAIATVFRVPHVLSYPRKQSVNINENRFATDDEQYDSSFRRQEEILQGRCMTTYTITNGSAASPLYPANAQNMQMASLHRDSAGRQRSDRMLSSGSDRYYQMIKSVDHDECSELVRTVKANQGNFSRSGFGYLNGFQARSSASIYMMHGDRQQGGINSLVIDGAHTEGYVTVNPVMSDRQQKIVFASNQTVSLVSSSSSLSHVRASNLEKETWMYKIRSPNRPGQQKKEWIQFLNKDEEYQPHVPEIDWTGLPISEKNLTAIKNSIDELVQQVEMKFPESMSTPFGGDVFYIMDSLASRIRALENGDLSQIFSKYVKGDPNNVPQSERLRRSVILDAFAVSGSSTALRIILDNTQNNKMSEPELQKMFTTMADNIASAENFNQMMNFIKQMPEKYQPATKSALYLSVSSMIRRLCILPSQDFAWPNQTYGANQCPTQQIDEFATFLTEKLQSETSDQIKPIIIQANAFLAHPQTVAQLVKVALKRVGGYNDVLLRILAVVGLNRNYVTPQQYEYVLVKLAYIAESLTEDSRVRQSALATLANFPHNAEFWQRLAIISRKEPYSGFDGFVKDVIYSQSIDSDMIHSNWTAVASHTLQTIFSQQNKYSSYMKYSSSSVSQYSETEDILWSPETNYTSYRTEYRKPYQHILNQILGGMEIQQQETFLFGNCRNMGLITLLSGKDTRERMIQRNNHVQQEFDRATSGHQSSQNALYESMCVTLNKEYNHLMQFTVQPIAQRFVPSLGSIERLLKRASESSSRSAVSSEALSFMSPVEQVVMIPSDNGFPIFIEINSQRLSKFNQTIKITEGSVRSSSDILRADKLQAEGTVEKYLINRITSTVKSVQPLNQEFIQATVNSDSEEYFPKSKIIIRVDRTSETHNKLEIELRPESQEKVTVFGYNRETLISLRPLFTTVELTREEQLLRFKNPKSVQKTFKLPIESTGISLELHAQTENEEASKATNLLSLLSLFKNPLSSVPAMKEIERVSVVFDPRASETKTIKATLVHAKVAPRSTLSAGSRVQAVESLSADDSIQQRVQKLRSSQAPVKSMWSAKLQLGGSGSTKNFEAVFLGLPSSSVETKFFQLNVMHGKLPSSSVPKQICYSGKVESIPTEQSVDREHSLLESKLYIGEKCQESSVAMKIDSTMKLKTDLQKQERSQAKHFLPSPLDEIKMKIGIQQDIPYMTPVMQHIIEKIISKSARTSYCVPKAPSAEVLVHIKRSAESGLTDLSYDLESVRCFAKDIFVPVSLTPVIRSGMKHMISRSISSAPMVAQCSVLPRSVKTFLGTQFERQPVKCYTIASAFLDAPSNKFSIQVKEAEQSNKQLVKLIHPVDSIIVEMSAEGVRVNGDMVSQSIKEIKNADGQLSWKIEQNESAKKVIVPGKFSIELLQSGEELKIEVSEIYKQQLVGLCGKFNERRQTDLKTLEGCTYHPSEGKVFAAAWVATNELANCRALRSSPFSSLLQKVKTNCSHNGIHRHF